MDLLVHVFFRIFSHHWPQFLIGVAIIGLLTFIMPIISGLRKKVIVSADQKQEKEIKGDFISRLVSGGGVLALVFTALFLTL